MGTVRVALVQLTAGRDPARNIAIAEDYIRGAAVQGAHLICTPENTAIMELERPRLVAAAHEERDDPGLARFRKIAGELKVWLSIGSLPIRLPTDKDVKLANRSFLIAPDGTLAARYDKSHLFDVSLPGGESYRESATYEPGTRIVTAEAAGIGRIGLTVCYDLRFAYLYRRLAQAGCALITVPSAFTVPTGEAHWHVLLRARAIETGAFILAAAQCGTHENGRSTYGHSLIVDPWGRVVADGGTRPGIVSADLDLAAVREARARIPAWRADRTLEG